MMREFDEQSQVKPHTTRNDALEAEARDSFGPRRRIVGNRVELEDTAKAAPPGKLVGKSNGEHEIHVSVFVKSKGSEQAMDDTLQKITSGKQKPLTDAEFNASFGADPASKKRVEDFAAKNSLKVDKADAVSGQIKLSGKVKDFNTAFGVDLVDYNDGANVNVDHLRPLSVTKDIAGDVQGVFGLSGRRQAQSHVKIEPVDSSLFAPALASKSFLPNEVADIYNFPKESLGANQSVGIIELGGGIDLKDNATYYNENGLKVPSIQVVELDGAKNKTGTAADGEVVLDSQVIGAVAPDANQQLIFTANTDEGFLDAVNRAVFPEAGEKQNTAISMSWGSAETNWSDQATHNMNLAFKKAALKGISVFAASGDHGINDETNQATVDYPAADPFVTGTGGTSLERSGKEAVWNQGKDEDGTLWATGGGISQKFDVPDFQQNTHMPDSLLPGGKPGRGVPDIAGDASSATGYRIRVNGEEQVAGGTSAVAPLYSALTMRLNGALGHPVGDFNPILYKNANSGIFRDVVNGANDGYKATVGWDAVTGFGAIDGQKFLDLLRSQGS